jgi:two-component sensor histidine kinase
VQSLQETVGRINAIARIHERLYQSPQLGSIDLADYLADVCTDLAAFTRQHQLVYEPDGAIPMSTDRAVRVALLATELITNAAKHAYSGSVSGASS